MQKSQRSIKRRAAPHFQAEEIRQALGHGVGGGQHVITANARGHQRLVRIAEGRVRQQKPLFFARPGGKFLGAQLLQQLARSGRRRNAGSGGNGRLLNKLRHRFPLHFGIAVEDDIADVREQLGGAVGAAGEAEQLRRIVEEGSGDFAGAETRMIDDIFEERDVRLDAADAELAQRAIHALAGFREIACPRPSP